MTKNCRKCGGALRKTILRTHEIMLGSMAVTLENAAYEEVCDNCQKQTLIVPAMGELLAAAALCRVLAPYHLEPADFRLFANALNMNLTEFAKLIEVSRETLSRWSNNMRGIGGMSEYTVRSKVAGLLYKLVPGIRYDPEVVVKMREFKDLGDGGTFPITFYRACLPDEHGEKADPCGEDRMGYFLEAA